MRTVEVLFVIIILLGAFVITTQFAVLPSPNQAFGTNLRELSQSTLETLDAQGTLSATVFEEDPTAPAWGDLQMALSASLPPNIVYNLNVYNLSTNQDDVVTYHLEHSISDASLGADSDVSSLLVTSPDVTFNQDPQKIGGTEHPITLYILNCSNANGWWITGYTGQSLAADVYDLLSKYFTTTVLVNTTDQLGLLLEDSLGEGTTQNAVVVNTFGEAVPIPDDYADFYSGDYAKYCYFLGQKVNSYNWTWVSIVGYPFYYVTNTNNTHLSSSKNSYGIYGMKDVKQAGLNAFLQGLKNETPYTNPVFTDIAKDVGVVNFTSYALDRCNYYGIYPAPYQTSARALDQSILNDYDLVATELFDRPQDNPATWSIDESTYIPAATYQHAEGGALTAIGLTRIPDIRVAALALLIYYNPTIYKTVFGASGTSVLVTLQLGQQGGT